MTEQARALFDKLHKLGTPREIFHLQRCPRNSLWLKEFRTRISSKIALASLKMETLLGAEFETLD